MKTYDDDAMPPSVVAELLRVHPKTVSRLADKGELPYYRTHGGHRRFRKEDVDKLVRELSGDVDC